MTIVATTPPRNEIKGDGNSIYTFTFKAFVQKPSAGGSSDIYSVRVFLRDGLTGDPIIQIQNTDYTVKNLQAETGQIEFINKTIPATQYVIIESELPYTQEIDFPTNAAVAPTNVQSAVDRLAMAIKQLEDLVSTKLGFPYPPAITDLQINVDHNIVKDAPVFFEQNPSKPTEFTLKAGDFTIAELKVLKDDIDAAKVAAEAAKVAAEQSATNAASSAQQAANAAAQTATNAAQVAQSLIDISKVVADGKADILQLVSDGTTSLSKIITDGTASLNKIVSDATVVIDTKVTEAKDAATDAQTSAGVAKTEADRAEAAANALPDYEVGSAGDVFITAGAGTPPVRQKYISGTDFSKLNIGEFFTGDGAGSAEKQTLIPLRNQDIATTNTVVKFFNDNSGKYLLASSFGAVSSRDVIAVDSTAEGGLDQKQVNELFNTRLNALAPTGEAYPWGKSETIADFIVSQDGYLISTVDDFTVLPDSTKVPTVANETVGNRSQYTTDGNYTIASHINGKDFFENDFSALLCLFIDPNVSTGDATIVANSQFSIRKVGTDIVYTVGSDTWSIGYTANTWVYYLLASDGIGTVSNLTGDYVGGALTITDKGDQSLTNLVTSEDFSLTLEDGIRMSRLVMIDKRVVQTDFEKFLRFVFNVPNAASGVLPPAVSNNGFGLVTDSSQYTQKPVVYSKSFPNDWTIDWGVDTSSPGLLDKKAVVFKADVPNKTLTVEPGDSGSGIKNFPLDFITNPPAGATFVSNIDGTAMADGTKFNLTVTKNGTVFTFDIEEEKMIRKVLTSQLPTIPAAAPVKVADIDDKVVTRSIEFISDNNDVGAIRIGSLADLTADRTSGVLLEEGILLSFDQNQELYAISSSATTDVDGDLVLIEETLE